MKRLKQLLFLLLIFGLVPIPHSFSATKKILYLYDHDNEATDEARYYLNVFAGYGEITKLKTSSLLEYSNINNYFTANDYDIVIVEDTRRGGSYRDNDPVTLVTEITNYVKNNGISLLILYGYRCNVFNDFSALGANIVSNPGKKSQTTLISDHEVNANIFKLSFWGSSSFEITSSTITAIAYAPVSWWGESDIAIIGAVRTLGQGKVAFLDVSVAVYSEEGDDNPQLIPNIMKWLSNEQISEITIPALKDLEETIDSLENDIDNLQESKKYLENQIDDLETSKDNLIANNPLVLNLESDLQSQIDQYQDLLDDYSGLESDLQSQIDDYDDLFNEYSGLELHNRQLNDEIDDLGREVDEILDEMMDVYGAEITKLETINEELLEDYETLQQQSTSIPGFPLVAIISSILGYIMVTRFKQTV